ncbi:hypothetical protein R0131_17960 [Clostridium sp. AL.422]|uniref:hypothetical protein n=1 Tax=Clostridium TaxID=1485 RepID=UPI00293DFD36|nr:MULTISPECIES: hypothetical protein [unclassified Clostridium]MDV4152717.1 hypothetical protein [Clostridium sp. AL.422]
MKDKKLNLLIYSYTGKLTTILYYIAVLIIIIPVSIVLVRDITVSSTFSKIIIGTAGAFIIIGKLLVIINKKKEEKNISVDIGILTGIIIALIGYLRD